MLQPEQAAFLLQSMLPTLKGEQGLTKRVIDAVPADKGDYRPDPVSMSALDLAWHIAAAENSFLCAVASGAFDFSGAARPESMRTSADVSRWYAENVPANLARVSKLSGDQLAKVIDFRGMFQLPAVSFLQFSLRHVIHHRGQLSAYLRPMGARVPAIYGESYDSKQARQAAQTQ